ncbi:LysR family transcriptional regulator [Tunturibacter empetritectus]|uniref:DNA-binding transcriptional LysR family regulator n=1 Tax=Tunturiibacter lichenicola TaxID=2051959 RepID=A0A7W8J8N9_9BACT|nr:LysR family transcriptional regulator [Edaphobacter lichenicola]MBB5343362.1 DNA-binding transcriptional LysR family regulator [Edaphobacter lichenicola]
MDGQIAVLAVAEKGSFEAAGKYLGVGKSAVRKRVRGVEIELGTPVFRSTANGMLPTDAGSLYLPVARESVRHASLGVDRIRAFLRVQTKNLHIGYSSHLNWKLLAIISQLQLRLDDPLQISRESLLTHQVITSVLQGDLNVGFGYLPLHEPDLFAQQLMEEPLMVCLPTGHPLSTKRAIDPTELDREPLIAVGRKALPGRHEDIVTHFESLGVALNIVADAYLPREALWMVSQGTGLAIMTRSSADSMRSGLVVRPLADRLLTLKSGVFIRREHDRSDNTIRQFVDRIWTETASLRMSNHRSDRRLHQ